MAAIHDAGRISKTAFIGTSAALFGVCIIASAIRFYVRFRIQREIGWDDGFLIFGLACLIAGTALLFTVVDAMYETEAMVFNVASLLTMGDPGAVIARALVFHRISAASLTLLWFSICCVKFSFLAFFKRLIHQMPEMIKYWWFTLVLNVIITIYGATIYVVACPYFSDNQAFKAMQCVMGDGLKATVSLAMSQMVLDILGDLLILVIPVILLYKIRIRFTQKIALGLTLCLTIVMIAISIARIAGLVWKDKLDTVWETFTVIIAAEIGLTLVSITAFRALYISQTKRHHNKRVHGSTTYYWYQKGKMSFLHFASRVTGKGGHASYLDDLNETELADGRFMRNEIPRGTMTGVGTFMEGNGKITVLDPVVTRTRSR
ncbi:hypothetical protein B0H63DRAFT_156993 [Podospora didyma]|uniref:Rhodopsin domain-containing protein n=1 Tax=Podospora didyma TaxID=330526 RepID=A0AAE0NTZ4_9PEZI|nr:hypothetical protein B0H63DRAFT_156993 [Podospora didyma]